MHLSGLSMAQDGRHGGSFGGGHGPVTQYSAWKGHMQEWCVS
jgi:hypothetical protein